jgi:hypothetical protein
MSLWVKEGARPFLRAPTRPVGGSLLESVVGAGASGVLCCEQDADSCFLLCQTVCFACRDSFNPATANSVRFANRGGSIFASMLAQHLGLNPPTGATTSTATAAGASSCKHSQEQLPALATWCGAFRYGRQPPMGELATATATGSSCGAAAAGVFGVLDPSVPDSCAMSFSARQAAALQAAVAMHRPKLHAACVSD